MRITLAEEVKLLAAVDCLKPLSKEELEEFAKSQPDVYFESGEILSTPWEEDERLLILKKGRIRIYRMWQGREQTLAHVEHGTALAAHRLHGSYVEAMEPVIVLALAKEAALRLIERYPEVAWLLIEGLTNRMRRKAGGPSPEEDSRPPGEPHLTAHRGRGHGNPRRLQDSQLVHP